MQSAPSGPLKLKNEYWPRPVRYLGLWESGPWRMKLYGLAAENTRLIPDLAKAAKDLAPKILPADPASVGAYGVGFIGVHSGIDSNFVFIDWWADDNELHHHVFVSSKEQPLDLQPAPDGLAACVFDLQIIWFERNAWVEKVLANSRGPNVELYLKRVLSDDA